jgi:hypothetical protein
LVKSRVGGGSGWRAPQRVLGRQRCLQAGHARGRVDPGELGREAGVFQRALPGGPVLGQEGGEVSEERTAGLVGAVGEERQPFAEGRHDRIGGERAVSPLEPC